MRLRATAVFLLTSATLPLMAHAADDDVASQSVAPTGKVAPGQVKWGGSGELGFAKSSGNTDSENGNAKLNLTRETARWKEAAYLTAVRSRSDDGDNGSYTSANRYEAGLAAGYKLDPRSYLVGTGRYEHDDFGANLWQASASVGYGYILLNTQQNTLSFEIGPGYKRYAEALQTDAHGKVISTKDPKGELIGRALIDWTHAFNASTSLQDTLLIEAGSSNQYYKNDLGLSVSMTQKLALKVAYELRYNSDVASEDTKHMDRLFTTNLVYNF